MLANNSLGLETYGDGGFPKNFSLIWDNYEKSRGKVANIDKSLLSLCSALGSRSRVVTAPALVELEEVSGCPFHSTGALKSFVLTRIDKIIKKLSPKFLYDKGRKKKRRGCPAGKYYKDAIEKMIQLYEKAYGDMYPGGEYSI